MERPRRPFCGWVRPVDIPHGLTSRPLRLDDAHAVFEVMAAQEARRPRRGDDRGGRHRRRLGAALASTSRRRRSASSTATDWSRTARSASAGRVRRGRRPGVPRPRASAPRSRTGCRPTPASAGHRGDRDAGAAGLARRPAARGARLPRPLGELGAGAARGRDRSRCARCPRGTSSARPTRGVRAVLDGPGGRVPRVVGARARVLRRLAGRDDRPARLRALEPARRGRPGGRRGLVRLGAAGRGVGVHRPPRHQEGRARPRPRAGAAGRRLRGRHAHAAPPGRSSPPTRAPGRSGSTRRSAWWSPRPGSTEGSLL